MKEENVKIVIYIVVIIAAVFILKKIAEIINSILEGLDITDTQEEKDKGKLEEKIEKLDFFNPNYLSRFPTGSFVKGTNQSAIDYSAKQIFESVGWFTDNPFQLNAEFIKYKNKVQINQLSKAFSKMYGIDMFSWLSDKFDSDAQVKVFNTIMKRLVTLPTGVTDSKGKELKPKK